MTESQKIPWKRIGIEASAIVVSILLAFAIDAWWDDVQDKRRAQSTLEGLQISFESSLDLIDSNLDEVRSSQDSVTRFLDMSPEVAAAIHSDERYTTLNAIWRPRTLDLNSNLLLVMLDSEVLKTLRNPALQEAVARWRDSVEELDELKADLNEYQRVVLLALGRHPEFWPLFTRPANELPNVSEEMLLKIRSDQDFMALTARKAFSIRQHIRIMLEIRERTETVLSQLHLASAEIS